jgi:DNA topoisomerase VI subunit B
MLNEDFRIDIKRIPPEQKQMALQESTRLFKDGTLDSEGYAKTYWIGTMDDVARELRRSLRKAEEMKKKMAQLQQQKQQEEQQQQQGMMQDVKNENAKKLANENEQNDKDRQTKILSDVIKQSGKNNVKQPTAA